MDINIFSQKMKDLRKAKGLSQDDVANKFNITVQAVSKWECGLSIPDVCLIADIAEMYGVSTDYLLYDVAAECNRGKEDDAVINNGKKYVVELYGKKVIRRTLVNNGEMVEIILPNENNLSVEVWSDAVVIGNEQ